VVICPSRVRAFKASAGSSVVLGLISSMLSTHAIGQAAIAEQPAVYATNMTGKDQKGTRDPGALKAQGKQLRIAIDEEYKRLKSDQRVRANDINGVDVSPTIREFVPIGTPLDEVAVILQAAGFKVRRVPLSDASRPSTDAIVASIEPLERGFLWAYYSSIKVTVRPGSSGDADEIVATVKFPMP
jgi:hypothetical protein